MIFWHFFASELVNNVVKCSALRLNIQARDEKQNKTTLTSAVSVLGFNGKVEKMFSHEIFIFFISSIYRRRFHFTST